MWQAEQGNIIGPLNQPENLWQKCGRAVRILELTCVKVSVAEVQL
jgi:hypothetical protein